MTIQEATQVTFNLLSKKDITAEGDRLVIKDVMSVKFPNHLEVVEMANKNNKLGKFEMVGDAYEFVIDEKHEDIEIEYLELIAKNINNPALSIELVFGKILRNAISKTTYLKVRGVGRRIDISVEGGSDFQYVMGNFISKMNLVERIMYENSTPYIGILLNENYLEFTDSFNYMEAWKCGDYEYCIDSLIHYMDSIF